MPTKTVYLIEKNRARNMKMRFKKKSTEIQKINRKAFHPASIRKNYYNEQILTMYIMIVPKEVTDKLI